MGHRIRPRSSGHRRQQGCDAATRTAELVLTCWGGFGSVFQCSVILVLHDEFFLEPVGEQRHEILLHEFEINLKNVGKIGEYVVD